MIVKDDLPFRAPEKEGLRLFTKKLCPLYKIPCEPTLTKRIERIYLQQKNKVIAALAEADSVSLTTDLWTHKYTMQGYLGVTVHFAKGSKRVSYEIATKQMDQKKTIENLRVALREVCDEWGIKDEKIVGVVTDGGANVKGAVKEEFGDHKHISCFAHSVNGIGQAVIESKHKTPLPSEVDSPVHMTDVPENEEEVSDEEDDDKEISELDPNNPANDGEVRSFLKLMKKIVRFFRSSEVASNELQKLQIEEGGKGKGLKLIQEVKTRWNSCYEMLERFLLLSDIVSRVLFKVARDKGSTKTAPPTMLTSNQLDAATEMKNLLRPLYKVAQIVSSEKHVSLSKIIHLYNYLKDKTETFIPSTGVGKTAKRRLWDEIRKRLGSVELVPIYANATLLDPRFKKVPFQRTGSLGNAIKALGRLVGHELNVSKTEEQTFQLSQPTEPEPSDDDMDDDVWKKLDEAVAKMNGGCDEDEAGGIPVELRQYLNRPPVHRKLDPLQVWEGLKSQYPHVYKVARQVLPTMSTSVPSERLFSHAGQVASVLRTRTSPEHLSIKVFHRGLPEEEWF